MRKKPDVVGEQTLLRGSANAAVESADHEGPAAVDGNDIGADPNLSEHPEGRHLSAEVYAHGLPTPDIEDTFRDLTGPAWSARAGRASSPRDSGSSMN